MAFKKFSIEISPEEGGQSWVFSLTREKIIIGVSVLLISLILSALFLYQTILDISYQGVVAKLRIENKGLREELQNVGDKVDRLEENLALSESFIVKIKNILSLDNPDISSQINFSRSQDPFWNALPQNLRSGFSSTEGSPFNSRLNKIMPNPSGEPEFSRVNYNLYTLSARLDQGFEKTELQRQSLDEVWELLADRKSFLNAIPSIKPAYGWISSFFGFRPNPITGRLVLHSGIDIAGHFGSPVMATGFGKVIAVGYDHGYGNYIEIDHGYQISTLYAHLSEIFVKPLQIVNRFDVIGAVGNSGRSTGTHLHYEVRFSGIPQNPMIYLLEN